MCHQCNYEELLAAADLESTENRLRVLEVVGNNSFPLSAADIYQTLERSSSINRVTVYRILDLLVDHRVVELAFRIPTKYNVTFKSMKDILKNILKEDFSTSFLYRKKQGFGNPLFHWFRNEDSAVMLNNLKDSKCYIYKYLDFPKVMQMIAEKKSLNSHNSKNIWRLVVLANYLEKNKEYLKRNFECLVDEKSFGDFWIARLDNYKPVMIKSKQKLLGQRVKVNIFNANNHYLFGNIV